MSRSLKPALALSALCLAAQAQAVIVTYNRIDLPDSTPGVDLVKHHYIVQGGMAQGDSLAVEFAHGLYGTLYSLEVAGPFDKTLLQPDSALDRDGLAILEPTADIPAVTPFSFDVVFSRIAQLPPTQFYGYRYAGDEIGFHYEAQLVNVVEPPASTVAEPASAALALAMLGLVVGVNRRRPGVAAPAARPT